MCAFLIYIQFKKIKIKNDRFFLFFFFLFIVKHISLTKNRIKLNATQTWMPTDKIPRTQVNQTRPRRSPQ